MAEPRVLWTAPDGDYRLIAAPVGGRPMWIVQFKERMGWEYFQQVPQCVALALERDQETRDAQGATPAPLVGATQGETPGREP